jgi:o-succinylbenzoate synthase
VALGRHLATPICLDESLTSWRTTRDAIELGACGVVCVKAPRLGSWLGAAAVLDLCLTQGVPAWVGGMLDGGLGRAANVALAAHPGATVTGDLPGPHRYFLDDHLVEEGARMPTEPPLRWAVPATPGPAPDPRALARLTRHVETVVRSR